MSVREEDKKKNCSGRGFGIAATALGIGVGAALYYYFSNRSENETPSNEGSTSNEGWHSEPVHALTENDQASILRQRAFRERSWTLEECSICFDVMLKDQELMALPCTHNFHSKCIMPWLQNKSTCPVCRKSAD
ncbi:hypothetical protein K1T71_014418 [Dendrolimus kikuchii]|uniref:Uncharacterized protein n=1 Tax=Dendrolimus kikuchii TaxID=765133 RepID=A0ACC1CE86_9NEOP|nr:hypothetical protein K1T71_014418 [Dendrolimus kikuchii]